MIPSNRNYIKQWQVIVSSAHPGGQAGRDWQIEIVDNHSAFGRSRVALASFKFKKEAVNFFKYCNSVIIRYLFLMTDESLTTLALKVPDILDYSDKNKFIDFSIDIDTQLKSKIGFTVKESAYIEAIMNQQE